MNISCAQLYGVGPQTLKHLARLEITTVQDLLLHFPFRYEDRTVITPSHKLKVGQQALVVGEIELGKIISQRQRHFLCKLRDTTGVVWLRFIHFNANQVKVFSQPGLRLSCYGEVRVGLYGLELIHPECRILKPEMPAAENCLTAIYPTTAGLSQAVLRKLMQQSLMILERQTKDQEHLPQEILQQYNLPHFVTALTQVHRPPKNITPETAAQRTQPMRQRLIFEELLAHQLSFLRLRARVKKQQAVSLIFNAAIHTQFMQQLAFTLTIAQQQVIAEIAADLAQSQPMLRLLQGDVGCGKTVVAVAALLQAVSHGYQAAIMAPTELLAEQHRQNLKCWLEPLGIKLEFLTGKIKGKARKEALQNIAGNKAQIVVGTHALFQEQVAFVNLALVVIDEQHRFGVEQRLNLWEKGKNNNYYPHQLIMTATPIPRTLAMTMYADLDISTIKEMPRGRSPVNTVMMSDQRRAEIIDRVRKYCQTGQQVYWICPLIEESEILQCKAAEKVAEELTEALKTLKIGLIHGRMKPRAKESVMCDFTLRKIDVLVATTVVEVGIDVKNANLIIIENAEKLGLVQLHQLRGRVGRGNKNGYCALIYQHKLSNKSKQRLMILKNNFDGFSIANKDLELRGGGELLGTKQTGLQKLKIADLICDVQLLSQVRNLAMTLFQQHILAVSPLIRRWLGDGEKYGVV